MKTLPELLAQTTLDSGEARHLAGLLGRKVSPPLFTHWCRGADARGFVAEKRGREWYVDRASWVVYLETPPQSGAAGHKANREKGR